MSDEVKRTGQLVYDTLIPNGNFEVVNTDDVGVRVNEESEPLTNYIPIIVTQADYNKLESSEPGSEVILEDGRVMVFDEERIYYIKWEITEQDDPEASG